MRQRLRLNADLNIGFVATVSARALNVARRGGVGGLCAGHLKIAGACPNTNNLIVNLETLSCEGNPSEVLASIIPAGRVWWPWNVLQ